MENSLFNKKAIKNVTDTTLAYVVNFLSIALSTLIIPKFIGVTDFSYWQLYHLYVTYVGFFHFGWADGIYLRQGGKRYSELNRENLSRQFRLYVAFEIIISVIVFLAGVILCDNIDKRFVIESFAVCILISVTSTFLQYLLQCTDRISEYAKVLIIERIIFSFIIAGILIFKLTDFRLIIISDLIAKAFTMVCLIFMCKDIVCYKFAEEIKPGIKDAVLNINTGIKLMIANIAGLLLIGIVKFAIELKWGIETFGKVGLTISISNMFMVFVTSVSVVLYPMLKNIEEGQKAIAYKKIRQIITWFVLGIMVFYYPFYRIVGLWLPQYESGLKYMALLFPICLFEGKTNLLCSTYFKALRAEKELMWLNIIALIITLAVTIVSVVIMNSIPFTLLGLMLSLGIRNTILEIFLWKKLNIQFTIDMIIEWIMVIAFCYFSWIIQGLPGMLWYMVAFVIYSFIRTTFKKGYKT